MQAAGEKARSLWLKRGNLVIASLRWAAGAKAIAGGRCRYGRASRCSFYYADGSLNKDYYLSYPTYCTLYNGGWSGLIGKLTRKHVQQYAVCIDNVLIIRLNTILGSFGPRPRPGGWGGTRSQERPRKLYPSVEILAAKANKRRRGVERSNSGRLAPSV
ncbi:hypothetical protein LZ30DRAFT_697432, partial [Colletotrichum cereale]